jgi:hypothetical protein
MKYFAYGSNMSVARLQARVPSAVALGCYALRQHDLRFHKSGLDGSAKCDAFFTGNDTDTLFGVLYEIEPAEKPALDRIEGLGRGYDEKIVTVYGGNGSVETATTYFANIIDKAMSPYDWYLKHVLVGALETELPWEYVQARIKTVMPMADPDPERDRGERAIYAEPAC